MDSTTEQKLLDEKMKLFKSWYQDVTDSGDYRRLPFRDVLEDMKAIKYMADGSGRTDPNTVSSRVRALMNALFASQLSPPLLYEEYISSYQSFVQKNNFFEQMIIDSESSLEVLIEYFSSNEGYLFRGMNEAKYMLYSSLQRKWKNSNRPSKGTDHKLFLERLISNARLYCGGALAKYINNNGGDKYNDISILSILQHYGCPTPLLDWTYNFLVALYFSSDGASLSSTPSKWEIDDYISVYGIAEEVFAETGFRSLIENLLSNIMPDYIKKLRKKFTEHQHSGFFMSPNFQVVPILTEDEFEEILADKQEMMHIALMANKQAGVINHLCRIKAMKTVIATFFSDEHEEYIPLGLKNSPNVRNQQGAFIWNSDPIHPIEYVVSQLANEDGSTGGYYTKCFNINKKLLPYIRRRLDEIEINQSFIYPEQDQTLLREMVWQIFEMTDNEFN